MKYGYFDNENREYVIDKVDVPQSWTNYLGVKDMCAVVNQTAGGYIFYKAPQYHRITRFRPNGVPMDRPGHYVYIRDNDSGEYWTISWQPVGLDLKKAKYECRHGLSYSKYSCEYNDISANQTLFIPIDDPIELWDINIKNNGKNKRNLSVYSYLEFSFHHIDMDNQNFQMSLYAAGSSYEDGIIEHDLFYEEDGYQFFTSNFEPDGFDCLRDKFIGPYRTETNPLAVEAGENYSSFELTGNHCGVLRRDLILSEGEDIRLLFMLGEGKREDGKVLREKYSCFDFVDKCFNDLKQYWNEKLSCFVINTPNEGMNTSINIWNIYQAEVNVKFSRFASFIEVGGRTGLGYRDTAQDAMTIPHSNPTKCKQRIIELLRGEVSDGYGLHLFEPIWFDKTNDKKPFKSPTVVPTPNISSLIQGLENVCSDDALWLVSAVVEYIKETGEMSLLDEVETYADGGEGTVYEHLTKILDFSFREVGETGICKGLRADWNDCLNLGGGESAMVSFLHYWAIENFIGLAQKKGNLEDVKKYTEMAQKVYDVCEKELWDKEWYIRGITKNGKKIGTSEDVEGKIHLESNSWAVLSGVSKGERAEVTLASVEKYLSTQYGVMLNAPSYTIPDEDIGFITRVYRGVKENGAIFSHANPWLWAAECKVGNGERAMKYYNALLPYNQNDMIEIREAEPYSYCQFIMGKDHTAFGRARHPFMTGSGGWAYFSATRYILGIRPDFDRLIVDPCIPKDWKEFSVTRKWRGATYNILVKNENAVEKGVKQIILNGKEVSEIPCLDEGTINDVTVIMG